MRKSLLFIGFFITLLVMFLAVNDSKYSSNQFRDSANQIKRLTRMDTCLSNPLPPLNNSDNKNNGHIKATPSFSSQSANYFTRLNQQAIYSYSALFKKIDIVKYRVFEPSFFHTFLDTLFRVIASPNAP